MRSPAEGASRGRIKEAYEVNPQQAGWIPGDTSQPSRLKYHSGHQSKERHAPEKG